MLQYVARRHALLLVALVALVFVGCGGGPVPGGRPNVLLISIDSLRADHLGSYGYRRPVSPVLDRLARRGAVFPETTAPTSWTLPSHISMLTSLNVSVHAVGYGRSLDPARETLAEILLDRGYRTAAFVTGPWMTAAFGIHQGFEEFSNTSILPRRDESTRPDAQEHVRSHSEVTSPEISDRAIRWIDRHAQDRFFLFLHYWDVHYDFVPPEPYDRLFDPDYEGSVDGVDFVTNDAIHPRMDPRDLEHVLALYDGEIRYTDHHIGRVLDHLESLGLLDDTVVIVTSDHGEEFFEHGDKGHNKTLHEEVIRVPLLLAWPRRVPGGRVVGVHARLVDLVPTVLDLAGLPPGEEAMGRSLVPALDGEEGAPAPAFLDLFLLPDHQYRGLRTPTQKTIVKYDEDATRAAVFDLIRDPGERRPEPPRPGTRFGTAFTEFQRAAEAFDALREALPKTPGREVVLDEETERLLRELGYVE